MEERSQGKQIILIADDSEMNRAILAEMLGDDYELLEAENGAEAVEIIRARESTIDLLLLDINMPELDGFQVLETLNRDRTIGKLPVIMISSESDSSFIERSYDLGATDYISRPFDVRVVRRRVVNTLMLYAKQKKLAQMVSEQVYEKERGNNLMISILSHIVEFRNGESGRHVINIRVITELLLRHMIAKTDRYGLTQADIPLICTASALHDIGKLTIPDEILNKPGRFTDEEFKIMKTHAAAGADMIASLEEFQGEPLVKRAYEICRWHHERWDGRGYPDGLKGDQIPISAQIVAVADVYDALTSERCYKKSFPHDMAIQMILGGECGSFDPALMDCLREVAHQLPGELLHASDLNLAGERQAQEVLRELLYRTELGGSGRVPWSVEAEDEKKRFWSSKVEELQFDYNAVADTVVLSEWGARQLGLKSAVLSRARSSNELLNSADVKAIAEALRATTPDYPEIDREMMLSVGGELRWYRVAARGLWYNDGEGCRYMGAVGKLLDVNERVTPPSCGELEIKSAVTAAEATVLVRSLRTLFDEVRLVDVQQARRIDDGGECGYDDPCYAIWGKAHRCANCISAKALAQREQLTKFELIDNDIYQIVSRYMEVDGKPCVMEMVTRVREEAIGTDKGSRRFIERIKGYSSELYIDSLTGVYNRRYYDDQIKLKNRFAAVAMIDVDDFKQINDTYGHYAGDLALQAIAVAMSGCNRTTDVLLRYGGDEFLLLYPDIPKPAFEEKIRQMQEAVRAVRIAEYPEIGLSISVGGVYDADPLQEAVQLADKRMYEAKSLNKLVRSTAERG